MPLELQQIKELIQSPKAKKEISIAEAHEARLRFHSQTAFEDTQDRNAQQRFLSWVQCLIPQDKYQIFLSLFRYPIKTVNLTTEAYSALEKVFDGRNPTFSYSFTDPDLREDWQKYRTEVLDEPWIWREEGFEVMKTAINSFIVVDLPKEQTGERPDPYFYFLPICEVIDFSVKRKKVEYLICKQEGDKVLVIDEKSYRVFTCEKGSREIKALELETPHSLGYCPAAFFWSTPISRQMPAVKRSPITNFLGDLDWYLFFVTSKRHLDLYAPYPIYSGFAQDCDYEFTGESGMKEHCDGGYLRDGEDRYIYRNNGIIAECPVCTKKRIAGAGSFIDIDPPSHENDKADLRNPVQITTVDRGSLDYNTGELERLERVFYEGVTGYGSNLINDQAVNEKQVDSFFEGRTNALRSLKKDFETAQQWTDETICRLRYGKEFISATIDYGNEFYLLTADALLDMYLEALAKGADSLTLNTLQNQYYETRFQNNPKELQRALILLEVEPLRHLTKVQARELYAEESISYEDYMMKVNFSSLIMRFERENTAVTEFGQSMKPDKRIEKIRQVILSYITNPSAQAAATEDDDEGEGQGEGATT
jgi:hypothetical protein